MANRTRAKRRVPGEGHPDASGVFDWKLDPVALAALVLSLLAAGAQFWARLKGPDVHLITPDRVILYSDVAPDGSIIVRIAAPMSYANVAQQAYGDVVLVERSQLTVGQRVSHQRWNAFGMINRDGVEQTGTAGPQPLAGQSAVTHLTLFTPVPEECSANSRTCNTMSDYLTLADFANQLRSADRLDFRFQIDLIDGAKPETSCYVPLSSLARQKLTQLQTTPFYAMCHAEPDRT